MPAVASSAAVAAPMRPIGDGGHHTEQHGARRPAPRREPRTQAEGRWLVSTAGGAFAQSVAPAVKAPQHEADAVGDGEDRADRRRRRAPPHAPPNGSPAKTSKSASLATKPKASGTPAIDAAADHADHHDGPPAAAEAGQRAHVAGAGLVVDDPDHHEEGGLERWRGPAAGATRPVAASAVPAPKSTNMKPSWLTVPKASRSLRSCWRSARSPPASIVTRPTVNDRGPPELLGGERRRRGGPRGRRRPSPSWRSAGRR